MKFKIGDTTDSAHCTALKHEFLRCEDAFKDFAMYSKFMIRQQMGKPSPDETRYIAYRAYNAYSRFIHHLYEFMVGALVRETGSTEQIRADQAESYINGHAQRILTGRRNDILNGTAPAWENHISAYPQKVPENFARDFRDFRNKLSGHVKHERSSMNLSDFYANYHKYLYMLYWNCLGHWGLRDEEFPDLKEITDFSVLLTGT